MDPVNIEYEKRILLPKLAFLNDYLPTVYESLEIFCVISNVLHLLILLQKSLRSNSTFFIMIEIAIFEIIFFTQLLAMRIFDFDMATYNQVCFPTTLFLIEPFPTIWKIVSTLSRRMFVWLMVQLALIRTLSISFPMSDWITKPSTTIFCSLAMLLFWSGLHYWPMTLVRAYWKPDTLDNVRCKSFPPEKHAADPVWVFAIPAKYAIFYNNEIEKQEGRIRTITIVVYTFLALILITKLKLINRKRQKMNMKGPSDNTTWLIIAMTITFLLSELSAAAVFFFDFYSPTTYTGTYLLFANTSDNSAEDLARCMRVLNSASHAIICYFMSTQYRDTVHKMLGCPWKKKKSKVTLVLATISTNHSSSKFSTTSVMT